MTRIIAGTARSRRIKVPSEGTRPTSDRAREGLFSSLQARVGFQDQVVLDLFAGSGALGLEALSRGARSVTLVDSSPQAVATIKHNIQVVAKELPKDSARVVEAKASTFVAGAQQGYFTMVLADPPYDLGDDAVHEMLCALQPLLADGAMVVVERHRDSAQTQWPDGFEPTSQKLKKRTFGIARFDMALWRRVAHAEMNE
ncbi:16S rRNA (guanine(966)-N(2))-methyltransferase RsmD [Corynebacterium sp. zg254]|uniref:16S rRNA (Guanine(966)-N(2))-methyltransferase RsmD n=1 Tax=Corynebacterium zhongnanshanii TaxID=2768834 RepID=A0ABQ6VFW3_9CORY|nr:MULTISPECIES: 16S rRNA (guanine(966)-N(2))-methyltransferase RsmD [Corynebacterium]KAB3523304.1 16S rRNA (guanine(966)-N(2))-methyltransferase RsmD [Corynebacterium zhongnanshanii]MCR5913575.1 16S rRNA (guanine(966)-N(2))-methyltransferase RsmD [Corynebacterium sp. zg254]